MEMSNYPNGMFCWNELSSNDLQKAKVFYAELFNWQLQESPIDDVGNVYIMFQKNNHDLGAMYKGKEELERQGINTHWLGYVAVDSVDETVTKIEAAGGEILIKPMDVFTAGRMALAKDPGGARFALWQGNEHKGAKLIGETNTVCWNELATRHLAECQKFYQAVFNWQAETKSMDGFEYAELMLDKTPIGGMMPMTEEWGDIASHWMTYFAVENCDASVEKAIGLGGTVCVPATDIPGVGRFSVILDPQKAVFSVIQLLPELKS